jgi:hypothetical protein
VAEFGQGEICLEDSECPEAVPVDGGGLSLNLVVFTRPKRHPDYSQAIFLAILLHETNPALNLSLRQVVSHWQMTALPGGQLLIVFHYARDDKEVLRSRLDCRNVREKEVCKRVADNTDPEFIDDPGSRANLEPSLRGRGVQKRSRSIQVRKAHDLIASKGQSARESSGHTAGFVAQHLGSA